MVSARTVNLGHIACERPECVRIASTYRRLRRFFQRMGLAPDWPMPIVARLLEPAGPWYFALDRTNWKSGTREVDFLVLAVVIRHFRAPLIWTLLPGPTTAGPTQIALNERLLASTIRLLLADREFIGVDWLKFLNDVNVRFVIRLRENLLVTCKDGHDLTLFARLRPACRTRTCPTPEWARARTPGPATHRC